MNAVHSDESRHSVTVGAEAAPAVALVDVSKSFGAVCAVAGLTAFVNRGETVAILGANGAGKSTIISMLLGLMPPAAGTVRLFGGEPAAAIAAGRVGAMLQDGALMPGARVGELLAMLAGLFPTPSSVVRVVQMAQLDGLVSRRVDRLSGGELQRVRVAAALIGNPELLILDEPTVAMDVESRREFWRTIRHEAACGRTILFSTHYLQEADDFADRIIVISEGRLLADGTPSTIKASITARVIRCTVSGVDSAALAALPGAIGVDIRQRRAEIRSGDADITLRALLAAYPHVADIEVSGVTLEDAFLTLTH